MLEWCKNRPREDLRSQILINSAPNIELRPQQGIPGRPKFACTSQKTIRKIKPTLRRTSIPQIIIPNRSDKQIQTQLELPQVPLLVSTSTQTQKVKVQLSKGYRSGRSEVTSHYPFSRAIDNSVYLKVDLYRHEPPRILQPSCKQSSDFKMETNFQTKATYCMADTKDQRQYSGINKFQALIAVESFHIPSVTSIQQTQKPSYHIRLPLDEPSYASPQSSQLYPSTHQPHFQRHGDLTFPGKHEQMLKSIKNQFKYSQQQSQKSKPCKDMKFTPKRRADRQLLYERQTIISKFSNSIARSQPQIVIDESLIIERQAKSLYTPLTIVEHYSYYNLYSARENVSGLVVSIKELSIVNMGRISEELLIYKQLQKEKQKNEGVLELYQTLIDCDAYLLIKEPFTMSLKRYVEKMPDLSDIIIQVQRILERMEVQGLYLKQWLKIEDFVVVQVDVKIQDLGVFTEDRNKGNIRMDQAVAAFRSELLEHLA